MNLQEIKNEVAKPRMRFQTVDECLHNNNLWPEVCKRYAFECSKASLEKATENADAYVDENIQGDSFAVIIKSRIISEQNIVIL